MHNFKIERLQAQLGDLKGKSIDTQCASDTLNPLSHKLEDENVSLEFQVLNYVKENALLKTTYKNLFDSINVTRAQTKIITDSLQDKLNDTIYENAKLRAQLFDKVSDQQDTTKGTSANTKFANQSTSRIKLYSQCLITANHDVCVLNYVNDMNSLADNQNANVSNVANQKKHTPKVKKTKKFMGTVRFGNDHIAAVLGYGDLQWGNILITRVYFIEGLGHILFSVG
ncbi:hypothetical protein Tco_0931699 [Tanacetum coccineum]